MTALLSFVGGVIATLVFAALGDMVSEEARSRLDRLPHALLRLAVRKLPEHARPGFLDDWTREMKHVLRGAESRPVTRLFAGTKFAVNLIFGGARRTATGLPDPDQTVHLEAAEAPPLEGPKPANANHLHEEAPPADEGYYLVLAAGGHGYSGGRRRVHPAVAKAAGLLPVGPH